MSSRIFENMERVGVQFSMRANCLHIAMVAHVSKHTCNASVSLDPNLEDDNVPDTAPIDRTKTPVNDEEEVCSFFDTWDEANDFYELYPELQSDLDPDGNGIPCDQSFDIDG